MSSRLSDAYEDLIDRMEEPPSWEQITSYEARLTSPSGGNRGWLAFAVGVAAVALIGVLASFLAGEGRLAAVTIPYVRIAWEQEVEMRCLGMEIVDNGGFDSAVIEIWGPSPENFYRLDAAAPDGTVERQIIEMSSDHRPVRSWFSAPRFSNESVFRVADCAESSPGRQSTFAMAQPPLLGVSSPFQNFVRFPEALLDESLGAFLAGAYDDRRRDEWRGIPVAVYSRDDSGNNEMGSFTDHEELWVDLENRRVERHLIEDDQEVLGSLSLTMEVTDRAKVSADDVSFDTEALHLLFDRSSFDEQEGKSITTTSIAAMAEPFMEKAGEIGVDDIPTPELVDAMSPEAGDQLFQVPVQAYQVLVRLRAGDRPHIYATSCDVLALVNLPEGWDGTCLERTVGGERQTGTFPYGTTSD